MTKIKVVGIGGSGGNAVSRMKRFKIFGVEFIAINTDYQDLKKTRADLKLRIGKKITQGLGTGMKPEIGEAAAMENKEEISQILKGADLVFLTGGLGGGTFSGAAPVVAEISKNLRVLTVAITTKPFSFEGKTRMEIAQEGLGKLKEKTDSLICIKNDKLLEVLDSKTSVSDAFWFCDEILRQAVQGIADLILAPGLISVNFADIKTILKNSGTAIFGIGRAGGEKRVEEVVKLALNSPLLDQRPKGAKGVLFYVSGKDISLFEVQEIGKILSQEIHPQAKVIFGASQGSPDEKLREGEIKLTLIATGF